MEEKTFKILSYCEIPEHITESHYISETPCGVYYPYSPVFLDEREDFDDIFDLDDWVLAKYPEIGRDEIVLIDIDY